MTIIQLDSVQLTQGSNVATVGGDGSNITGVTSNYQLEANGLNGIPIGIVSVAGNQITLATPSPVTLADTTGAIAPSQAPLIELQQQANNLNTTAIRLIETQDKVYTSTNETEVYTDRQGVDHTYPTLTKLNNTIQTAEDATNGIQAQRQVAAGAVKQAINAAMGGMSGFVEMGKHYYRSGYLTDSVNSGLFSPTIAAHANGLSLGAIPNLDYVAGSGESNHAIVKVDNTVIDLYGTDSVGGYGGAIFIKLPEAPNGLQKADGTGEFADLAAAITAGGTDLSASVINRTDLCIGEYFDELINYNNRDMVCPFGITQWGASTALASGVSIPLVDVTTLGVGQGYSAFHENDTTTVGKVVKWSTLDTLSQHAIQSDPKWRVENTADGLVQRKRVRLRTIAGLEGDWSNIGLTASDLRHSDGNGYVIPQGSSDTAKGLGAYALGTSYKGSQSNYFEDYYGCWNAVSSSFTDAYKGFCVAMPICTVERLNQGAYHPVYNENGACTFAQSGLGYALDWYQVTSSNITNISKCFEDFVTGDAGRSTTSGYISSTNGSGHKAGLFYDAIYAHQVRDLRTDASRNWDLQRISDYVYQGCANGDFSERETEYLPFTVWTDSTFITNTTWTSQPTISNGRVYITGTPSELPDTNLNLGLEIDRVLLVGDNGNAYAFDRQFTSEAYYASNSSSTLEIRGLGTETQKIGDKLNELFPSGTTLTLGYSYKTNIKSKYWTDIIGSPSNIAATFSEGLYGAWIPEIPDGTSKSYKMNRKVVDAISGVFTDNTGTSFTSFNTWNSEIEGSTNARLSAEPSTRVITYVYEYAPKFTESANQVRVDFMSGRVFAVNSSSLGRAAITQSLIGKVATFSGGTGEPDSVYAGLIKDYLLLPQAVGGYEAGTLWNQWWFAPTHDNINLGASDSPAVKYFIYLHINDYNIVEPYAVGKEMVFDSGQDNFGDFTEVNATSAYNFLAGTSYYITSSTLGGNAVYRCVKAANVTFNSAFIVDAENGNIIAGDGTIYFTPHNLSGFGDDNKFNIVDGEAYVTDYNGNTVKVVCHKIKMPFNIYLPRTIKESN